MNTIQINNKLKNLNCFKGTYPINKIKFFKTKKRPLAFVINLDPDYMPGSHWVAIYIDRKNNALYFDSFGVKNCPKLIKKFLKKYKVRRIYLNKYMLQSITSQTCGAYTILFIKMLCSEFTFAEFLKLFTKETNKNDKLIIRAII